MRRTHWQQPRGRDYRGLTSVDTCIEVGMHRSNLSDDETAAADSSQVARRTPDFPSQTGEKRGPMNMNSGLDPPKASSILSCTSKSCQGSSEPGPSTRHWWSSRRYLVSRNLQYPPEERPIGSEVAALLVRSAVVPVGERGGELYGSIYAAVARSVRQRGSAEKIKAELEVLLNANTGPSADKQHAETDGEFELSAAPTCKAADTLP